MIRSMTGFGSATLTNDLGEFFVEVKSLNNRFLDVGVKLPKELNFLEPDIRDEVRRHVRRGKIDLYMRWVAAAGGQPLYEIDTTLLSHYVEQVRQALPSGGGVAVTLDAGAFFSMPGVVHPTHVASDDGVFAKAALQVTRQALEALDHARQVEGSALVQDICTHLRELETFAQEVATGKDELLEEYRTRLKDRIEKVQERVQAAVDPARLEMELVLFADKSDITEELVRLQAHFAALRKLCAPDFSEAIGKSMDFLVQELLREVNTIGNKARGLSVASRIVQMKSQIEKIREQVQNLE